MTQNMICPLRKKYVSSCNRLIDVGYIITCAFKIILILSQESERSCIYVLGVSILHLFMILIFNFAIVASVWYVLFFHFITYLQHCLSYFETKGKIDIDLYPSRDFSHMMFIYIYFLSE